MNTYKVLREEFIKNIDESYPIWYYKQIREITVDDVVFNLLKETFVVELNNKRIVMTFGSNGKNEIGCNMSSNESLEFTSYETIIHAFKDGKWFRVSSEDTSEKFKENYRTAEAERKRLLERDSRIATVTKIINMVESISEEDRNKYIAGLKDMSDNGLAEILEASMSLFRDK